MQYSSRPKTALVRKAEQRKAVPFTVVDIGGAAELKHWKEEQERSFKEWRVKRDAERRLNAIKAFNSAGLGHYTDYIKSPRKRETTTQQPKEAWLKRMVNTVKHWCLSVWRNAGFDNY